MKVYCVMMYVPYEGSYLDSIWSTDEKAQEKARAESNGQHYEYGVEEWEVDEPNN